MNKNKLKSRVDPVEVFCRQRPLPDGETESCLKILDDCSLLLQVPECSASYKTGVIKQLIYSFTQIFDEFATQRQLFDQTTFQFVQDLVDGKNGLLFTYGVTGSGKTFTMIGNQKETGLLQRTLDTLFSSIINQQANKYVFKPDRSNSFEIQTEVEASIERHQRKDILVPKSASNNQLNSKLQKLNKLSEPPCKLVSTNENHIYSVFISCIEIYNNYIYDLLDEFGPCSSEGGQKKMDQNLKESKNLKEDTRGNMYIKDTTEIEVKSSEEALELMNRAKKRRVVAYTDLNSESSRSHSIITIRVVQTVNPSNTNKDNVSQKTRPNITVSQLSLVDLAGSERTKRTKNTGCRLKEAGSINSSLMALRNCMETLRENLLNSISNRKMVPYRDSKLTLLFKNYFEGYGKIKMILCINPSAIEFDETINVLKFSDLVKDVLVPVMNYSNPIEVQQPSPHSSSDQILKDSLDMNILKKLQENNYSFMKSGFPSLDLFSPDDDQTINNLITYLEEMERNRNLILKETEQLKQTFLNHLRQCDENFEKIKEERDEFKQRLDQKEKDQIKSDSKIKTLEKIINTNCFNTPVVGSKSSTDNGSESDSKSKPKTSNSAGGMFVSSTASSKLKINIQSETPTTSSIQRTSRIQTSVPVQPTGRSSQISNGGGGAQLNALPPRFTPTNGASNRNRFLSPVVNSNKQSSVYQIQQQFQNLALKDGVPVGSKRNQRRSRSAETWLDHKPSTTAKLDTVMQPKLKHKRSVNKLEISDTQKSSKYVLTYQQQDDEGEVVTNLIKGDILKSPGGGSNVVFTDLEVLQTKGGQELMPTSYQPQRRPPSSNNEAYVIENRALIEERCSIAIEGNRKTSRYNK